MGKRYDAVVVGMGPGGEVAALRLMAAGRDIAVVERELIGGECGYWACVPSKTLLRPPEARAETQRAAGVSEAQLSVAETLAYRDVMVRNYDDSKQVKDYEDQGAAVFKGDGRIAAPNVVQVGDDRIEATHIIVATGSDPVIPPIEGLDSIDVWTNREATGLKEVPESIIVMGGGPVGVEMGQLLARFGSHVKLVQGADRVLNREDPQVSALLTDALEADGIEVHAGRNVVRASADGDAVTVELDDGSVLGGDELLVATGRSPRTAVGFEEVGVTPGRRGVAVDERCGVTEGVWALGDVTGTALFTHVAKYQARIAVDNILGKTRSADYRAVPRVVFTDPEIATVGLSEEQARAEGHNVVTATIDVPANTARPWTYEREPKGSLGLVADRDRGILLGAWAVSPLASEWIHYGVLAIKAQVPVTTLADTVAQFPTFAEAFLIAVEQLDF